MVAVTMDLPLVAVHGEASRPATIRAEAREVDLQRRSVGVTVFYPDSPARLNFAVPWGRNDVITCAAVHLRRQRPRPGTSGPQIRYTARRGPLNSWSGPYGRNMAMAHAEHTKI
jgi:hypothetical protein